MRSNKSYNFQIESTFYSNIQVTKMTKKIFCEIFALNNIATALLMIGMSVEQTCSNYKVAIQLKKYNPMS